MALTRRLSRPLSSFPAGHRDADASLYLAVGGDSIANMLGNVGVYPANVAAMETKARQYFSTVKIEQFAQGGVGLKESWLKSDDGASNLYFWDDDNTESTKLTGRLAYVTDPAAVNAVLISIGTNDPSSATESGFGSTYTKAGWKTALTSFCAYLKTTAFPNVQAICILPWHRNDTSSFAQLSFQAVREAIQEVTDELDYVMPLPAWWDVDLTDNVHPLTASIQGPMADRIMAAIATHLRRNTGGTTGPYVSSAVMDTDSITLTITHDKGTDLSVPANAAYGIRIMQGGTFSGGALTVAGTLETPSAVTKGSASTIILDLDNTGFLSGQGDPIVYMGYGQAESLSGTSAEVIKDNAAIPLPVRQGSIQVTETDLIRKITGLVIDVRAKTAARATSGSDITAFTDGKGVAFTSSAGRYASYDGAEFGGMGALVMPDSGVHYVSGAFTGSNTGFGGIVCELPGTTGADLDSIVSFGNGTNGNTRAGLMYQNSTDIWLWRRNNADSNTQLVTNAKGKKWFILWNFRSLSAVDFYLNSLTPVTIDPYDVMSTLTNMWLFNRTNAGTSFAGAKIAAVFHKNDQRGSGDPTISDLITWINTAYGVGATL